jgi:hypothetical protein
MSRKVWPFVLCWLLTSVGVFGQTTTKASCKNPVVVKSAIEQRWSGGVVGRRGINYTFDIETLPNVVIDTVWIDSTPYPVSVQSDPNSYIEQSNATIIKNSRRWTYQIRVGIDKSDFGPGEVNQSSNESPVYDAQRYDGVAFVSYMYKSKRNGVVVKTFERLSSLNYP